MTYTKARTSSLKSVQILLQLGASVDSQDRSQRTPLHVACAQPNVEIIDVLLRNNAKINQKSKYSLTPVFMAAMNGCLPVLKYLLQQPGVQVLPNDNQTSKYLILPSSRTYLKLRYT